MPESFKLIIITPESSVAQEARLINELFEAGLQLLHIRKPGYTMDEIRKLLLSVSTVFHSKIVIHSHYELLNEFNLKGAHLPENIREKGNTDKIKQIVSTSFHKLEDIPATHKKFEYAFFSPVFQSISKQGYEPAIGKKIITDFFTSHKNQMKFPIVALGGITDENILQAQEIGFGGAACIGYIWENPEPVVQFRKLQKVLED